MPANTEKSKVLHSFKAGNKNESVANIIDGSVQLYVLSYVPGKFHGKTEMVFDCLPKAARVDFVTDISKENSIQFFWAHRSTFDLRPEGLSTKGLERFRGK